MGIRIKLNRKPCWIKRTYFDVEITSKYLKLNFSSYKYKFLIDIFEVFIDDKKVKYLVVKTKNMLYFEIVPILILQLANFVNFRYFIF